MLPQKIYNILSDTINLNNNFKDFYEIIDSARRKVYYYNRNIIERNIDDIDSIGNNDDISNSGRFDYVKKNIKFQNIIINGSSKNLYVTFSAARSPESLKNDPNYTIPEFSRWSYYGLIDGTLLGISDPMFRKFKGLKVGWFYGSKEQPFYIDIIEIVKKIQKIKNINDNNIIFIASSAGGYISLLSSCFIKNSLSIAINPQIFIQDYYLAKHFTSLTGINLNDDDIFYRNNIYKYLVNSESKHVIISNIKCEDDYCQIKKLSDLLGIKLRYGLNIAKNILIWIYEADGYPSPHLSQETRYLFFIINFIALSFKNNESFNIEHFQNIALTTNEFWYDLYSNKYNYLLKSKIHELEIERSPIYIDSKKIINELDRKYVNIKIIKSDSNYNFYRISDFAPQYIYSIEISGVSSPNNIKKFTYGLFDFRLNKKLKYFDVEIDEEKKYYINFITNHISDLLSICIYSGIAGNTRGNDLFIKEISIYKKSVI